MRWPVLLRRFVDLLFPPDPGALRLLAALRATLAALAAFVLVVLFGEFAGVPVSDRILGFVVALFITANVRDSTLHQRLVTIALAPFLAFFTTSLAAFLLDL